ncbi:MAG: hypothetical protein E6G51_07010 [Actinobacteria bacterium]|nr:MAG: hypothetical protein E6G51_07010 [Actinomycetota bacterium]
MASEPRPSLRPASWLGPKRAWAVFVGLAVVLGFLDDFDVLTKVIANVWDWCGAHIEITVLTGLLGAMAALIVLRQRVAAPPSAPSSSPLAEVAVPAATLTEAHTKADKETFEALAQKVDRNLVNYLRDHDFGNPWDRELIRELAFYVDGYNEVENTFHDPVLEHHRQDLHAAARKFINLVSQYGTWSKHLDGYNELDSSRKVAEEPPEGETWERWNRLRGELGDAAHVVVEAYDELVLNARLRAP